ncbi:hypothetical protein AVEN_11761-1 [Araneus ventricosus]|uniref:Uncharacterized protein n=1 Tax=Araneus ventricosus TaxID=182803 RepID=A0A4Y2HXD3_ARAVE|nr:hypothetical protein AVEN_11761-1 [Araneus ventricosus]
MSIVTTVSQEDFCGLPSIISEHYIDARDSRILRDSEDVQKPVGSFESRDPFPVSDFVMSISTGILGDETINCHIASECGNSSMSCIVGKKL